LGSINLSNLIAQDLTFIQSNLTGCTFDPDYLGSYLFDQQSIGGLSFMYRGQKLDLVETEADEISALIEYMNQQNRYSEAFSLTALFFMLTKKAGRKTSADQLFEYWCKEIEASANIENFLDAKENCPSPYNLGHVRA
jgi:hypothetical protein